MFKLSKIILLLLVLCFTEARISNSQFTAINDCICPGYNSLYECTVTGGIATVWTGTAINCLSADNEIILSHNTNFTSLRAETCNRGAVIGRAIRAENEIYTSQLVVRVSTELNRSTIVCAHDTGVDTPVIGSMLLTITQGPFPPPTDVQLAEANDTHLSFNWTQLPFSCPSIHYHIMAVNCGDCPNTTTSNRVICSGNYMDNHQCSFAVQTVVCGDIIGNTSTAVNVTMTGSAIESTKNKSSLSTRCIQDVSSSAVVPFGTVIGAMFFVIVFISSIFIITTVKLIKSKQTLREQLDLFKAKMKEQPVIYEEIGQLQDSLKSSSPVIDVGENTAYVSAISMNACVKVST